MSLWLPLLIACSGGPVFDDTAGDTGNVVDTGQEDALDVDEDGSPASTDCDDYDPAAYPGNTETWDGKDNDCDGTIDGRGSFSGRHALVATAVFEGTVYRFDLDCPTTLVRHAAVLDFTVTCSPDPTDPDAMRMLGRTLTIVPVNNAVPAEVWFGTVSVSSSDGWEVSGTGDSLWTDMDSVYLATELDSLSLDLDGGGGLSRDDTR